MYFIITRNQIPGFHYWPDAPLELAYLAEKHRHVFNIECIIPVDNDDRDIEIISMQNQISKYMINKYGIRDGHIDIGPMSCEALAKEIAEAFNASQVTVTEDGYGGGGYVRQ